jgi:hypothetical protein
MASSPRMSSSLSRMRGAAPVALSGAEEEERIMGEWSFFYYSNMDEEEATTAPRDDLLQECNNDNNKNGDNVNFFLFITPTTQPPCQTQP